MNSVTQRKQITLEQRLADIEARLTDEKSQRLFAELKSFPLGLHLIEHSSLSGKWTKYSISDQAITRKTSITHPLCETEDFILNRAPIFLASQDRFQTFRHTLQELLHDDITVASIACGYMDEILSLDYSKTSNVRLVGIDIDPESTSGALQNSKNYNLTCTTYVADAWKLECFTNQFDLITSNGLNVYVSDTTKEQALYHSLASTLKNGGYLVTSFLTPPPWELTDPANLEIQKLLFGTILGVKWQVYRTEEQMRDMLATANLTTERVIYDSQRLFPTIVARKL